MSIDTVILHEDFSASQAVIKCNGTLIIVIYTVCASAICCFGEKKAADASVPQINRKKWLSLARETGKELRHKVIYCIYVRSHTVDGTFNAIVPDLDRIKNLGADMIWFMPIHPCGRVNMKGSAGSPYAIQDYREVNPEYGTKQDFENLVAEIHSRGMKCMIDVVYNHTSPDSFLVKHHPEYFYKTPGGEFGNKVADWGDIIDLDFNNPELWDYLIETLKMWAGIVDGFRCDVAPLIPLEFWRRARMEVETVRPGCVWLAETVEGEFIKLNRGQGLTALSDGETYQAFDITYDYDVINFMRDYFEGKGGLKHYIDMLNRQDVAYPENYVKLRFLENHDRPRAKSFIHSESDLLNWTAFLYFQKGTTLVYAGQEAQSALKPSLFEVEKVDWDRKRDISGFMRKLYGIKQHHLFADGDYFLEKDGDSETIIGYYEKDGQKIAGVFPVKSEHVNIRLSDVPDGCYKDLINGQDINVRSGAVHTPGRAVIFKVEG